MHPQEVSLFSLALVRQHHLLCHGKYVRTPHRPRLRTSGISTLTPFSFLPPFSVGSSNRTFCNKGSALVCALLPSSH